MNIRATINKLQKALIQRDYIYKINTYQFYSDQQNRMIIGYRITENDEDYGVDEDALAYAVNLMVKLCAD